MDEAELNSHYGKRLEALFGPDYREHEGYRAIVDEVKSGRYPQFAIGDREEKRVVTSKRGW